MNSNPVILKVVIVIIFNLSGTIYLPFHYLKMTVISVRYFFEHIHSCNRSCLIKT